MMVVQFEKLKFRFIIVPRAEQPAQASADEDHSSQVSLQRAGI
jgi:hypothetical protein